MSGTPFETDILHNDPNQTGQRYSQFRQGWRRGLKRSAQLGMAVSR